MVESLSPLLTVIEEARKTKIGGDKGQRKEGPVPRHYTGRHLCTLQEAGIEMPSPAHSRNTEPLAWIREFALGARP